MIAASNTELPRLNWVSWSPTFLTLTQLDVDGRRSEHRVPATVPSEWRYQVRLVGLVNGGIVVLTGDASGTRCWMMQEQTLVEVELPDVVAALPPDRVHIAKDGRFAAAASR